MFILHDSLYSSSLVSPPSRSTNSPVDLFKRALYSGVASTGASGVQCPLDSKKIVKKREKLGEIGKKRGEIRKKSGKEEKSGRKGKNREGSFTLPLLTDRAGYATGSSAYSFCVGLQFLLTAFLITYGARY